MIAIVLLALAVSTQNIPAPDLKGVEPQVAEKIHKLQTDVGSHPNSAEAWGKLGMSLHVHGFLSEAVDSYKHAVRFKPNEFRWIYYEAVAVQEMNASQALPALEACLKLKSDYGPLQLRYGQALLAAGRGTEAEGQFRAAIRSNSESAEAYIGLAHIQLAAGNLQAAETTLLEAVQRGPDRGELHGLLSEIYRVWNQPGRAEKELSLSQQLPKKVPPPDPELAPLFLEGVSSYWYELRARALIARSEYAAASEQLIAATRVLPDPRLYDLLGIADQYQQKYADAVEAHRHALALQPNSAGTMNNLAMALIGEGKDEEAIQVLKHAVQVEPDFFYSYRQLVRLELRRGLPKQALDDSLAACQQGGCIDAEGLSLLSLAYAANLDFDHAIQTARQAKELASSEELKTKIENHLALYEKKKIPRE